MYNNVIALHSVTDKKTIAISQRHGGKVKSSHSHVIVNDIL